MAGLGDAIQDNGALWDRFADLLRNIADAFLERRVTFLRTLFEHKNAGFGLDFVTVLHGFRFRFGTGLRISGPLERRLQEAGVVTQADFFKKSGFCCRSCLHWRQSRGEAAWIVRAGTFP